VTRFFHAEGRPIPWAKEREQLRKLLTEDEYLAARASTTNAHYTSPEVITAMWDAVRRLGFGLEWDYSFHACGEHHRQAIDT
jgi:hypothetical protein